MASSFRVLRVDEEAVGWDARPVPSPGVLCVQSLRKMGVRSGLVFTGFSCRRADAGAVPIS